MFRAQIIFVCFRNLCREWEWRNKSCKINTEEFDKFPIPGYCSWSYHDGNRKLHTKNNFRCFHRSQQYVSFTRNKFRVKGYSTEFHIYLERIIHAHLVLCLNTKSAQTYDLRFATSAFISTYRHVELWNKNGRKSIFFSFYKFYYW